ncbi:MAG: hypothetical protein JW754_02215 [Candidatus Aenigmarchaeota archaeon]|nr:hypothetical protein [Candidatus Aenigmarchaeota archaeon]
MGSLAVSLVKEEYGFDDPDFILLTKKLAEKSLKTKQKEILYYISLDENRLKTSTRLVLELSMVLRCSQSALWNNFNCLKDLGLIHINNGRPVKITDTGRFVLDLIGCR